MDWGTNDLSLKSEKIAVREMLMHELLECRAGGINIAFIMPVIAGTFMIGGVSAAVVSASMYSPGVM